MASGNGVTGATITVQMHHKTAKSVGIVEARRRLFRSGQIVRNRVLLKLSEAPKTGRVYYVPGTKTKYTASAPGETPARRTGDLARSYLVEPRLMGNIDREIFVGSELKYALYLEQGTHNTDGSQRMAPRPHLVPAWEDVQSAVIHLLKTGEKI